MLGNDNGLLSDDALLNALGSELEFDDLLPPDTEECNPPPQVSNKPDVISTQSPVVTTLIPQPMTITTTTTNNAPTIRHLLTTTHKIQDLGGQKIILQPISPNLQPSQPTNNVPILVQPSYTIVQQQPVTVPTPISTPTPRSRTTTLVYNDLEMDFDERKPEKKSAQ